ncbi:MAG: homoserine O-acetyltransferase [Rickettsiales bacterium]|nr:homoserine O-acetyltransferase [Rickettsiales bacterium]
MTNLPKTYTRKLKFGTDFKEIEVGDIINLCEDDFLELQCGAKISNFPVAFKTFGTLNEEKSNAILICHALTGDQFVIGTHPVTGKNGWWENYVGEGKPIDTNKFFIIAPNVLGGCMGSYGPKDINPETGEAFNLSFPMITISDMVLVQKKLIEKFGIKKLACVIGGSMGGMQAMEWISKFPENCQSAMLIATSARHSAQNIAFNEIGRQAIMADPEWCEGNYIARKCLPSKGLSIARMMAHITYLSESGLHNKFGRKLQNRNALSFGFDVDFQVESYLRYQGMSFVERFDPNSYLYITRAMDYFDLEADFNFNLAKAFEKTKCPVCVISFSSDWLFTTENAKQIVHALVASSSDVSFVEIESDKGHDSFLLPNPMLEKTISGFLAKI